MNPLTLLRTARNLLTVMVLLFCFSWVADLEAQQGNRYQRLPSDHETLGWAATIAFTEGPTVDPEGNVFFTDGPSQRIMRLSTDGELSTFRHPSHGANGLIFDLQGRLIACEAGDADSPARVTRTDLETGSVEVIGQWFEGKRIMRPNDVTIDGKGRIYFTDRRVPQPAADQTGVSAVYRIDPNGTIARILTEPDILRPNGLMVSPDDKTFYLVETNSGVRDGQRLIRAYDLAPDGTASNMWVFHDFGAGRSADGLAIDTEGNLYAAAGLNRLRPTGVETLDTKGGIHVFKPSGELKEFIPIPVDTITNCAFGGPDMKTLYITAGMSLLTVRTKVAGTRR